MRRILLFIALGATVGFINACTAGQPENVSRLWLEFEEASRTGGEATLLDFSYAGYKHGEADIPNPDYKVFDVCDFGAVPNDGKSDREAFQRALDAAAANGSGIVYFPAGRFDLHGPGDPDTPIIIEHGNIVIRGAGYGEGGTEIFMELPLPAADPDKMWTSPDLILFRARGPKNKITDVVSDARRGSFSIEVADASSIRPGDRICLELKNNHPDLIAAQLHPWPVEEGWTDLTVKGVQIQMYHQVTAVEGNTIHFKEPLMHVVESKWGWFVRQYPRLENIGVENIAFVGNFHEEFVHHKNWLHDGGYKMFTFNGVADSWIRDCRFTDVSECVSIISSANVSATRIVITGNTGHSALRAQGSSRVFFGMIEDRPAQWHSVGISKPAMGNVIWRVNTNSNSCFESHASQPRASLFDMCESGFMRYRAGGAEFNNPNHLGDLVLWNFKETDEPEKDFDFWADDSPYWKFVPPIIVGFHGAGTTFNPDHVLVEESNGRPVWPSSLYEAQLELRLGKLPDWLLRLKTDGYLKY